MSIITNQAVRLDILHVNGIANTFTLQVLNTTDGSLIDFNSYKLSIILKDPRNNDIGSTEFSFVDNYTAIFFIKKMVPENYSGTIKYMINMEDLNSNILQLIKGNIDCVDTTHIPASTSSYVTDGNQITVNTTIGSTNNITIQIANGFPGAVGPAGPQGEPGSSSSANIQLINIDTWDPNIDKLDIDSFTGDVILVLNSTFTSFVLYLNLSTTLNYSQSDNFIFNKYKVLTFYKIGNTIISAN